MVYCCVPQCGTDSWRCDPSITFHEFPSNPDIAARWIHQINHAVKSEFMWFPRANSVVCSKHFLSNDYKDDSDSLKPRVVPTVFGHKYIGLGTDTEEIKPVDKNKSSGPLIVKIKTEDGGKEDVLISEDYSQNSLLEALINEPEHSDTTNLKSAIASRFKTYSKQLNMGIQHQTIQPTCQEISPNIFCPTKISFIGKTNEEPPIRKFPLPKTFQGVLPSTSNTPTSNKTFHSALPSTFNTSSPSTSNTTFQAASPSTINTSSISNKTFQAASPSTINTSSISNKTFQAASPSTINTSSISNKTFQAASPSTINTSSPSTANKTFQGTSPPTSLDETNKISKKINKKPSTQNKVSDKSKTIKKKVQKRDNNDNNLIEIGPNTFLKINPDIIKVNKKQTPSGNTVLQFLMDQNLAHSIGTDVLPKIVQGAISNIGDATSNLIKKSNVIPSTDANETPSTQTAEPPKTDAVVQHVVGHLVDTHVCKQSCTNLQGVDDVLIETNDIDQERDDSTMEVGTDNIPEERNSSPIYSENQDEIALEKNPNLNKQNENASNKADSSCIAKAPILLTTNMPLAHCFMEKTKYLSHLRQKARQIASLKQKVANLNKKIEELEDRCVVQERQLSFSFLKKLRTIRKNASKGDPPATYILEQIRAYTGQKQMRWSDSTLQQCAVWCKKAPYAYEYFKKADFFKLPCLGTVKRFMKKHPEMAFSNKTISNMGNDEGESSSDFNFDEEDSMGEQDHEIKENQNGQIVCEAVLSEETDNQDPKSEATSYQTSNLVHQVGEQNTVEVVFHHETGSENAIQNIKLENATKSKTYPVTVDGTNLEVQELILPSGEVVQCYSSNICSSGESNSQYYIIPSTGDPGTGVEHEYSIVQSADSVPVILQNLENSNLQQEQLIFITNSSDQVECTETEVMTAR